MEKSEDDDHRVDEKEKGVSSASEIDTNSGEDSSGDEETGLLAPMDIESSSASIAERVKARKKSKKKDRKAGKRERDGEKAGEESSWQKDKYSIALLLLLYTLQGVPMGISRCIPLILQDGNASDSIQGAFSFSSWPFSLKLLWAPIVDACFSKSWGQRKTWLIPSQMLIGIAMIASSFFVDEMLGSTSSGNSSGVEIGALTSLFFCLFFLCATQDIAVDGWALTMLSKENVGYASTCNAAGQMFGATLSFLSYIIPEHFGFGSLKPLMLGWGICFICTTLVIAFYKTEKPVKEGSVPDLSGAYKEMLLVVRQQAVRELIALLLTAKFAFAAADMVAELRFLKAGLPKGDLATMTTLLMPLDLLLPGMFAKYTAGPKPFSVFVRAYPARLLLGVLVAILLWCAPQPFFGEGNARPIAFYAAFFVLLILRSVVSTSMFVSQMGFFAKVSDPRIGGTYMTMLNTVANLSFKWPASLIFYIVEWTTTDTLDGFYPTSMLCTIVGVVWLLATSKTADRLQSQPLSDWRVPMKEYIQVSNSA